MTERSASSLWWAGWPLALLCLLDSSRWMLEGARPELASTEGTEAFGCVLAAGVLALSRIAGHPRRRASPPLARWWVESAAGSLVLTGTALAASASDRFVNSEAATLALCLTPVVTAVALPAFGVAEEGDLIARLWPGLAGMAGLLLLLPQPDLVGWRFDLALAAMPLMAGCSAVLLSQEAVAGEQRRRAARWNGGPRMVALLLAAVIFGSLYLEAVHRAGGRASVSPGAAVIDGVSSLLTLEALARVGAMRWTAQFLLIPLITLLEGVVLLRPLLDWRSWLAFALLAVSGTYLLWGEPVQVGRD